MDPSSLSDFINIIYFGPSFTTDSERNIYISERDSKHYEITKLDSYGTSIELVSNYFSPFQKSDIQLLNEIDVMESMSTSKGVTGPSISWIPKSEFDLVSGIDFGPDGNLWARRGYTEHLIYDIFNTNGLYIKTVILPGEYHCTFWIVHVNQYGLIAFDLDPERSDQIYIIRYID